MKRTPTLLSALLIALSTFAQAPDINVLFSDMKKSVASHKTVSYRLFKSERIKGKFYDGDQYVRLNASPLRVYVKIVAPNEGAEVLYRHGENDNECLVRPNSFPYINLNLDPDGSILRKGQHHSVKQLPFSYTVGLLQAMYDKYYSRMDEFVEYKGDLNWKGRDCHHFVLTNLDYGFTDYTVKAGEDIIDIARKTFTNEYTLLEQNDLRDFDSVKAGDKIKVPTSYCEKLILYIDKKLSLPVYQKVYDENGHCSTYEYTDVKINPKFSAMEFERENEAYGF